MLQKEGQSAATSFRATPCTANSVDIIIRIIGRIKLDNPVNLWEIKASLSDICAKEDSFFSLAELKVCGCALLLFLFTVNVLHGDVNIVEQVRVKFDGVATRHEHHDLLLQILSQESE